MYELFIKTGNSWISFGFFSEEKLSKAKELLLEEYPNCSFKEVYKSLDVLKIKKYEYEKIFKLSQL